MTKFLIRATRTTVCEFTVDAESESKAYELLDDWIADDFEDFIVDQKWDYDLKEE